MRDLLWIVLACTLLAGHTVRLEGQKQASSSSEECAVYSVVLDSLYRYMAVSGHLVEESTIPRESLRWGVNPGKDLITEALKSAPPLPDGLLADFEARNAQRTRVSGCAFQTRKPVGVLGSAEVERISEEVKDLDEYPERYAARGMVAFSRVGFTPDRQQAFLYHQFHCGGRCGIGQIVVLAKQDGHWIVQCTVRVITF